MAYYERDYFNSGRNFYGQDSDGPGGGMSPFGGRMGMESVTVWLIIINVAVFILDALLRRWVIAYEDGGPFNHFGYFSADKAIFHYEAWRFLTFQFLHSGIGHILFNMLCLFYFGGMVEGALGRQRFLAFYLLCGVMGPLFYLVFWQIGLVTSSEQSHLVGASAGVFGVMVGAARLAPNMEIRLLFPPITVRLKMLVMFLVGLAVFVVVAEGDNRGSNAGGEAAHLGGAVLGFVLVRRAHLLRFMDRFSLAEYRAGRAESRRLKQFEAQRKMETEVDRILEKVSSQGLASLTNKEKRTLQQATEARRGNAGDRTHKARGKF